MKHHMPRIAFPVSMTVSLVVTAIFISAAAQARPPATPHESEALEIYRTIVSYPTYQGAGKVPEMARYLAGKFRAARIGRVALAEDGERRFLKLREPKFRERKRSPRRAEGHGNDPPALCLAEPGRAGFED